MTLADYQGIAIVIGAVTASIVGIGGLGLQIAIFRRQGRQYRLTEATHELVDGVSKKLSAANKRADFSEGEKSGTDTERARNENGAPRGSEGR